ncbi:MAG: hypothetical protein ABIE74_07555 [Pseudomonadota bacterium]
MKKIPWKKMHVEEMAAFVCSHLKSKGIDCVLSGGTCVTIYSNNQYKSSDMDFVMAEYDRKEVDDAMNEIGFKRTKSWRHFENPNCPYWVEFPPTPLAAGDEIITKTKILNTDYGKLKLLRPIDCVKDRLAAFYHWGDRQSLDQAVMVANDNRVSLKELTEWSEGERSIEKFKIFLNLLRNK